MQRLSHIILAVVLLVATVPTSGPIPSANAGRMPAAVACTHACDTCPCCAQMRAAKDIEVHGSCCAHRDTGSSACETETRDCGSCPCCSYVGAPLVFIAGIDRVNGVFQPGSWILHSNDLVTSRSDEPLLPPPIA